MKKRLSLIAKILTAFVLVVVVAVACEEKQTIFDGPYYVRFTNTSASIAENATSNSTIRLHAASPKRGSEIEVKLSVQGGTEGVDFDFVQGGTTLTIPAGEYFTQFVIAPIDNDINDGAKTIRFTIESVSGGLDAGFGLVGKTFTYSITDDDCATPSLEGKYLVYNRDATPAGCGNPANDGDLTYEATITLISEDGDERVYEISDITGGLYALCYGDGENTGQIRTSRLDIILEAQPDVVYGGDEFNGTGEISCNGNFVLTWANGYGDKATSYYTKK